MPRRDIVTIEEVQRRRATSWEMHYRNRQTVRQMVMQVNAATYINTIKRHVPSPEIEVDGYLYRPLDVINGEALAAYELGISQMHKCLMCLWYWTDTGWDQFVQAYQSLPEIVEDHYWVYDEERDGAVLVPMSSRKLRADARYNLGTSPVQVSDLYLEQD